MTTLSSREPIVTIRRRRAREAVWMIVGTVATAELLFASFAIGASFGPAPLRPLELAGGFAVMFAVGAISALMLVRKRIERDASMIVEVGEGRRKRRVAIYDRHLTIGAEIIAIDALSNVELDAKALVLRYQDAQTGGPMLRELTGDKDVLVRLASALQSRRKPGDASPLEP